MASLARAFVTVTPDTRGFGSALTRDVGQAGSGAGRGFTAQFTRHADGQGVGRRLGAKVVAGFAAIGVGRLFAGAIKTGFDELKDAQRGLAQFQAGLKTTGGAAGITAQQMTELAGTIQAYSGQTDDSIVATGQLLLTFTNIRNAAGKNNDVFTQTVKIAADMAARFGGDASRQAIVLGKALNDPVKGLTALRRVGVSFSTDQIALVKRLVETGRTMDAQKVILAELNREFGGSARAVGGTLPGKIEILRRKWEDLTQSLAERLLPTLIKAADAGLRFMDWLNAHPGAVAAFGAAITGLAVAFVAVKIAAIAATLAASPWALAIGAVVAVIVFAYIKFAWFRDLVQAIFGWIKGNWPLLLGILTGPIGLAVVVIAQHWGAILRGAQGLYHGLIGFFRSIPGAISSAIGNVGRLLYQKGRDVLTGLWDGLKSVWNDLTRWVGNIAGWIKGHKGPISLDRNLLVPAGKAIMQGFYDGLKSKFGDVASFVSGVAGAVGGMFGGGTEGQGGWPRLVAFLAQSGVPFTVTSTTGGQHARGSYHYQGRAVDLVGPNMMAIFSAFARIAGALKELFYDPAGAYVKNGRWIPGAIGGHMDHVHVAFDQGGVLPPGRTMAVNNTGRDEFIYTGNQQDRIAALLAEQNRLLAALPVGIERSLNGFARSASAAGRAR